MRQRTCLSPRPTWAPHGTDPPRLFPEPGLFSSSIRFVRMLLTSSRATRARLIQGKSAPRNLIQRIDSTDEIAIRRATVQQFRIRAQ